MSIFTDLEKDAASVDGFVSENGLIPTRRNGPKPSWQYLVDRWNAEIAAAILEMNKSRGFRVVGTFADGFTYELFNDVGIDADGNSWIYVGAGAPNKVVPAGTVPSVGAGYEQVTFNTARGVTNANGGSVQDFIDFGAINDLKIPAIFPTVVAFKESLIEFPDGKTIHLNDRNADFIKITGTGSADGYGTIASSLVNQSITIVLGDEVSINNFGALAGLGDTSPAIQAALNTGLPVVGEPSSLPYNCQSTISILTRGQVFNGKNKELFTLDFRAGGIIDGIELGYVDAVPENNIDVSFAQIKNMKIIGASTSDTDRNAALKVKSWTRGMVENVITTGFAIGHSWEGNALGHANTMLNVYHWKNRVTQVYLDGGNHATNFIGGELAQGHYGAVIGKLNSDGTIDDDFGGNTGGNITFFGTIIEGQDRTCLAICNGQLGVTFDGYFESAAPQDNFVRIGSKFKNDGITLATAVPKGIHIRGHAGVNAGVTEFPAVKIGAVVGGSCSLMVSGNNATGIDTTELRFSTNFSTDGMWVSSGKYAHGDSDNTLSADVYAATKVGGAYSRRYMTYSNANSGWRSSLTIPRSTDLACIANVDAAGKVFRYQVNGVDVGSIESENGRMNIVSKGTASKWKNDSLGVILLNYGSGMGLVPETSGNLSLGNGSLRFSELFSSNGTINTSDENLKTELLSLDDREIACAMDCKRAIRKYKMLDSVAKKGESARIHFGVGAQTVKSIFDKHGLNANDYSLFCYDEIEGGGVYGVRYDQLAMFMICAI